MREEPRPLRPGEHKGALYQLKTNAPVGEKVTFAGVWDKYGYVVKHQEHGYHLIRGTGHKPEPGTRYYSAEVEV